MSGPSITAGAAQHACAPIGGLGVLAAMLTIAACGTGHPGTATASAAARPLDISMSALPSGTATLTLTGAPGVIRVDLGMHGFAPRTTHSIAIHGGSCARGTSPVVARFTDASADTAGALHAVSMGSVSEGALGSATSLVVGRSASPGGGSSAEDDVTSLACGGLPPLSRAPVLVPVHASTPATGTAVVTYDARAHALAVRVQAHGLAAMSRHALAIERGTCEAGGGPLYPLPDVTAGSAGDGSIVATILNVPAPPPVRGGWYLDLRAGPSPPVASTSTPGPDLQPLLCGNL